MGLGSQSLPLEQAGEGVRERWPVIEKEGGRRGRKVEVVELDLAQRQGVGCGRKGRRKKKSLNREGPERREQRKPEQKGSLTTCRSFRGPIEYYNKEFCFLAIGTCYQVCIAASVRTVNKAFWFYLPLEAQGF